MNGGKLLFKRKLRFAFTVKSPVRLFFTVILSIIAFSFTGICLIFAFFDRDLAETKMFKDARDVFSVFGSGGRLAFEDMKDIGGRLDTGYGMFFQQDVVFCDLDLRELKFQASKQHFSNESILISCFSEKFFIESDFLAGGVPQSEHEILISSCNAKAIMITDGTTDYADLIGRKIELSFVDFDSELAREEFSISGVYDNVACTQTEGYYGEGGTNFNCTTLYMNERRFYSSVVMHEAAFVRYAGDSFPYGFFINGRDAGFRARYHAVFDENELFESTLLGSYVQYAEQIEALARYFMIPSIFFSVYAVLMLYQLTSVSIERKRNMIGVLRALGCRRGDVMQIFLMESLFIGFVAGAISCGITAAFVPLLNRIVQISLETEIVFLFCHPLALSLLMLLCLFASALSAIVPILIEMKKSPIENIKA